MDVSVVEDVTLRERVAEWLRLDSSSDSCKFVQSLIEAYPSSKSELEKTFLERLEFGTAGLRAPMGPGFNKMNRITVVQTSLGLCNHMIEHGASACKDRGIIIGYDGRHNSESFAHITAAVFLENGFTVYLIQKPTATPLVPFGILKKNCMGGVQITASHNPKNDNGFKVYAANGAQIIPPVDEEISNAILSSLSDWPQGIERWLNWSTGLLIDKSVTQDPYNELAAQYVQDIAHELCYNLEATRQSNLKIVYTAMHGVGFPMVEALLRKFGFESSRLLVVGEQQWPDPCFSTVAFPNPEEKGALDLALALAEKEGSPLIIANDPDADRLGCAEKSDGKWHAFSGDEIGIILASRCMQILDARKIPKEKMLFICSAVSSRMLAKMADVEHAKFLETMTGFKWMMNAALDAQKDDLIHAFSYEEALGYAVSLSVPDKDGISAAAVFVQLACELYTAGRTVQDYLSDLREKYGFFVSNNSYFLCYDKKAISSIFNDFRDSGNYRWQIGRYKVARIRDVTVGYDSATADKRCRFPLSPSTQMITLFFDNGAVLTFRTSGTEPKLKWYSEHSSSSSAAEAAAELQEIVSVFIAEILKPDVFPLQQRVGV